MIQKYIEEFEQRALANIPWLDQARKASIASFEKNGFPTQRLEEWKDTNLTSITNTYFQTPTEKPIARTVANAFWENHPHVIFHNGFCEKIAVSVEGVTVEKFSAAISKNFGIFQSAFELKPRYQHAFLDLNTSMAREGAAIHIQKNAVINEPIYLVYQSGSEGLAYHYRNLIKADAFSSAKIIEVFISEDSSGSSWTIPVTQIHSAENSIVEHAVIQDESNTGFHTGLILGRLESHSRISTSSFSFGGKVVRNDIHMILDGQGAHCDMNGLYVVGGTQIVDHHTTVDHAKPHCTSSENYKGVLMEQSHGIFEGMIRVAPDAQKTDAKQLNQNLLLSSQAKINTAPQLEILADDVKCAHGATIGKLDENQVFYLRSRGIDLETARQMLVSAYAGVVISKVTILELQEELQRKLSKKIGVA